MPFSRLAIMYGGFGNGIIDLTVLPGLKWSLPGAGCGVWVLKFGVVEGYV